MGSKLLAAVPSKSSKNISRIPNPFPLPRHAISTLTPSICSPIWKKWAMFSVLYNKKSPLLQQKRLSKQWVFDYGRSSRARQSVKWKRAVCLMDPQVFKMCEIRLLKWARETCSIRASGSPKPMGFLLRVHDPTIFEPIPWLSLLICH